MSKTIKMAFVQTIIAVAITAIISWIGTVVFKNDAKIELISSDKSNGNYQTIIAIKSLKSTEYLKNIEIILSDDLGISSISVDGNNYNENVITIDKIEPKKLVLITIESKFKIDKGSFKLVKNGQNMSIEEFNNYQTHMRSLFMSALIYLVINSIILFISNVIRNNMDNKLNKYIGQQEKAVDELNNNLKRLDKKYEVQKAIFMKELAGMEKEIDFYQEIIRGVSGKSVTKDELDKLISKKLKTYNIKKQKNITYDNICNLVIELTEENKK